ncbi:glycoside hydrolase family 15 protein [Cellvibrio japonicus]|uniref:Phosphorylase kinase alpha subunit n=1 Tax=Cellvibrio japonicus (strain Ueda107) TaxID=498211 RepID=B3PGK7_CELJU|nr:glycoside hydrolase family 15 protein [Cellvibrio japonicus]ACE85961.1 phosphorylase kinase alpha subunit [Cellvibrio japonicus Ueda107]QEI12355.1 phosphorylase kinase [Cellvibrio japonicus]QEI15928.1 phosphorylase kinase [Cellvibrio japonicus]QEI19507.1 phosphorylase kinase [Cellvibrio japonicus]
MKHSQLLERLYSEIHTVILNRQHPVSGLLPASTAVNNHGDYTDAWVRDNVYSVICVWSLGLAYRRQGENHRSDLLEQATIKLMRGLLQAMMRQAHKVEAFKYSLDNRDSLHAKYDTATGLPVVADDAWGHLQIDATSLYLLMLGQMSASGLRIVCTPDEVDFVQNLVYYISSAYRTPDYGIWERGNKVNNGKTEINASSVGMAKAALQAMDGFNVFGKHGDKRGIIHVIADAISLARTTLASLLPRESLSKETDSALLSIIGFPAFAVGKETLARRTRDSILTKLGGNYGCKRFLWDGHQTVLEESSRIYYEHAELVNFANIESEWPLFFTYLYITALFDGSDATAKYYRKKLESLMVHVDGYGLLPELYYLPQENIEAEKKSPRSQPRVPNENIPLVWAQSLYLTGLMLDEGLVSTDDLDPLKMRRRSTRFIKSNIALVVLAENESIKNQLVKYGVIAESLQDIKPMGVVSATGLMEVYSHVGENKSLGLTGRPRRRAQSLATSQTYEINNKVYLSLSWMQTEREDYRLFDAQWVVENLTREIEFIYKNWLSKEVAVFTLMVDQRLSAIPNVSVVFDALRDLQLRNKYEYVGYASANLAYRASRVNHLNVPYSQIVSLTNTTSAEQVADAEGHIRPELLEPVARALLENFYTESDIITYRKFAKYVKGRSLDSNIGANGAHISLLDLIRDIFVRSQKVNYWLLSRFCFAQFNYSLIDLTDSLTLLAARNLVITVGDNNFTEIKVDQSFSNASYFEGVRKLFPDELERTLIQEVLSAIGSLIRSDPPLFDGLHSVQLRNFMLLCAMDKGDAEDVSLVEWVGLQSPAKLYKKIRTILTSRKKVFAQGINHVTPYKIHHQESATEDENSILSDAMDTDWLEWRTARGLITHFDSNFLRDIWHSLMCARILVFGMDGSSHALDCEITRSSMTPGEDSFAHLIDQLTHQLHPAYYKSAVVEALYAFTQYCINHPDIRFHDPLVFRQVLERAAKRYVDERRSQMMSFGIESDLTLFMQQSPHILNLYVTLVYAEITQSK